MNRYTSHSISAWHDTTQVKILCVVSPHFGLKHVKMACDFIKVGKHFSLSSEHPILWSNFNSKKLVRSETPSCIFARVRHKGVQIAQNIAKVSVHIFISNGHPILWSNFISENLVKSETPSFDFAKVWLKGGENSSEHHEIFDALLSN